MGAGPVRRPEGKGTTREPARRRHGHAAGHRTRPRLPTPRDGNGHEDAVLESAGLSPAPPVSATRPPSATRRVRARIARRITAQRSGAVKPVLEPLAAVHRELHPSADMATLQRAYDIAEQLARRPDAQERRPVHHASAGGRDHPRRARDGHDDAGRGPAARHRRGHRLLAREARLRLRRRGLAPRRRRHQARQGPARRRGRGGDDPQDGRGDGARPARARHQAGRPAAQHAHDALPQAGEAGQEGPRDPRGARAAGPPAGDVDGQVGARGPRVRDPAPQALRRDRPPRRRPRAEPRHLPALGDRRGLRPAHRGPGEGRGARAAEALLLDLPEDDRQG